MKRIAAVATVGLILALTGCARAISTPPSTTPLAEASPSTAAESPTTRTTPTAAPTPSTAPPTPSNAPPTPSTVPPLIIASASFHAGEVSVAYTPVTLGASGGKAPYHWSISSGALPVGLGLSGNAVSGNPGAGGTFGFTVRVDDSSGQAAGVARSISVARLVALRANCAVACSVEQGCVTVCGGYGSLAGGIAPFRFALIAGSLPPGTTLNGLALAGTFTTVSGPAPFSFTVTVTDALGARAQTGAAFSVFGHIAFSAKLATCTGGVPSGCAVRILYTGGTPNGKPKVTVVQSPKYPKFPAGSSFTASGGIVNVLIAGPGCGSPFANTGYDAIVDLVLVDQSPCGAGFNCSSGKLPVTIHLAVC